MHSVDNITIDKDIPVCSVIHLNSNAICFVKNELRLTLWKATIAETLYC